MAKSKLDKELDFQKLSRSSQSATTLRMKLSDILHTEGSEFGQPLIVDRKRRGIAVKRGVKLLSISENLLRVQELANPLEFLVNAQNGALFPVIHVEEDDTVVVQYKQFTMSERLSIAKFLANKIMPSLSLTKIISPDTDEENSSQASFAAIVEMAAARANQHPTHKMTEILDAEEVEDVEDVPE